MIKKIPCGGFYVNDDAVEMIDGKPVLKTSGSDEVLDNAKATGGIGYTEQGEQTVITWDGNTEGRDVLTIIDSEHPDNVIHMYKVAEYSSKPFTESCELVAAGSPVIVSLITYDHAEMYGGSESALAIRTDGTDFDIQYIGTVHAESSGVYFLGMGGAYVESLTYGGDTVHKINEKYLPSGVVAVNFSGNDDDYTADKTPQEIISAFNSGTFVYGVLNGIKTATLTKARDYGEGVYFVEFDSMAVFPELRVVIDHLEWNSNDSAWAYSREEIPLS